jgi:hypothetical protein
LECGELACRAAALTDHDFYLSCEVAAWSQCNDPGDDPDDAPPLPNNPNPVTIPVPNPVRVPDLVPSIAARDYWVGDVVRDSFGNVTTAQVCVVGAAGLATVCLLYYGTANVWNPTGWVALAGAGLVLLVDTNSAQAHVEESSEKIAECHREWFNEVVDRRSPNYVSFPAHLDYWNVRGGERDACLAKIEATCDRIRGNIHDAVEPQKSELRELFDRYCATIDAMTGAGNFDEGGASGGDF